MKYFIMMGDSQDKRHWAALYTHFKQRSPVRRLELVFSRHRIYYESEPETGSIWEQFHIVPYFWIICLWAYHCFCNQEWLGFYDCHTLQNNGVKLMSTPWGVCNKHESWRRRKRKKTKQNGPNGGLMSWREVTTVLVVMKIISSKSGNASNTFLSHKPKFQECIATYFIICVFCSHNSSTL